MQKERWRRAKRLYGMGTGAVRGVAGQRPSRCLTALFISRARNALTDHAFRQKAIRAGMTASGQGNQKLVYSPADDWKPK